MSNNNRLTDEDSAQRTTTIMRRVTAFGILWFLFGFALYFFRFHYGLSQQSKDWSDFGVFIAGFSGTGIAAVTLYAVANGIRVQAEDLAKSRAFMAEQSVLMAKQSEIMTQQAATTAQQAFDSVFFNLLETFNQLRDSVTHKNWERRMNARTVTMDEIVLTKGRFGIELLYEDFKKIEKAEVKSTDRPRHLQSSFNKFFEGHESELGPYFRMLYQVFKWIERAKIPDAQKIDYAKMARAQLSDVELCIIFYDGITELAVKMKPLIEQFGILKHVNAAHLLIEDDKRNLALYARKAFGEE